MIVSLMNRLIVELKKGLHTNGKAAFYTFKKKTVIKSSALMPFQLFYRSIAQYHCGQ